MVRQINKVLRHNHGKNGKNHVRGIVQGVGFRPFVYAQAIGEKGVG